MADSGILPWGDLAAKTAERLAASSRSTPAVWQVRGSAGAGKSTFLSSLRRELDNGGLFPVLVDPSPGANDAGAVALMQIGAALEAHGVISGELDRLTRPNIHWNEKLEAISRWVSVNSSKVVIRKVVILCDEPMHWASRSADDVHFSRRTRQIVDTLLYSAPCDVVVTGEVPEGVRGRTREIAQLADAGAFLEKRQVWRTLADAAAQLARRSGDGLRSSTPLQAKLLVALAAATSVGEVAERIGTPPSVGRLVTMLADCLMEAPEFRPVLSICRRLGLARRPVAWELVEELGARELSERACDILRDALLTERDGGWILHDMVGRGLCRMLHLPVSDLQQAHRRLAEYFADAFEKESESRPEALLLAMEAYHHATESADPDFLNGTLRPFFADQLSLRGKAVSLEARRTGNDDLFDRAASFFEMAVQWQPEDDYAHHYYAFNLDVRGRRPDLVERHYRQAIELSEANVWWRSRWINYLITRGRTAAAREAWSEALAAVDTVGGAEDTLYENMHVWVARLLLHRGQLDFAAEVLRDIPWTVKEERPGIRAMERRLRALQQAQRTGAVFPLTIAPEDWWRGPHLAERRKADGHPLRTWFAGRVEEVTEDSVVLHVAEAPASGREPVFGHVELEIDVFDRLCGDASADQVSAGRFVEIAYYEGVDEPRIRLHPDREFADRILPPLFPDPVRYLRSANWVS
jgi:tetratricopeptide (TPR) repeat protein